MRILSSNGRFTKTVVMICLACAFCFSQSLAGLEQIEREGINENLKSKDKQTREKAFQLLVDHRQAMIKQFVELAGSETLGDEVARGTSELAIDLLGEFRAAEAVDFLINKIDFSPPGAMWSDEKYAGYPCVKALVKIGKPASLRTVDRLGSPDLTATQQRLLLTVLNGVEGKAVTVFLLENARNHAVSEKGKTSYVTALAALEDIKE